MKNKGFTLIELMIVVAIIAIIAAIAIPSLLRSRMAANETACAASCKAYAEAQEIFHRTDWDKDGVLEYSQCMGGVSETSVFMPNLIDSVVAEDAIISCIDRAFANACGPVGTATPKSGYVFGVMYTHTVGATTGVNYCSGSAPGGAPSDQGATPGVTDMTLGYAFEGVPGDWGSTGQNNFCISNSGTIYQRDEGDNPAVFTTNFDISSGATAGTNAAKWIPSE
jgi:prepilin-type N-terminal cleavage/methylation domain-containing protein